MPPRVCAGSSDAVAMSKKTGVQLVLVIIFGNNVDYREGVARGRLQTRCTLVKTERASLKAKMTWRKQCAYWVALLVFAAGTQCATACAQVTCAPSPCHHSKSSGTGQNAGCSHEITSELPAVAQRAEAAPENAFAALAPTPVAAAAWTSRPPARTLTERPVRPPGRALSTILLRI